MSKATLSPQRHQEEAISLYDKALSVAHFRHKKPGDTHRLTITLEELKSLIESGKTPSKPKETE